MSYYNHNYDQWSLLLRPLITKMTNFKRRVILKNGPENVIWAKLVLVTLVSVISVLLPCCFGLQVLDNMRRVCQLNELNCNVNHLLI